VGRGVEGRYGKTMGGEVREGMGVEVRGRGGGENKVDPPRSQKLAPRLVKGQCS
jgi:hypothetical protein